jgi:hypothetical protein
MIKNLIFGFFLIIAAISLIIYTKNYPSENNWSTDFKIYALVFGMIIFGLGLIFS